MKVKFKKLHEDAVLPNYAKLGDAGLDITAVSDGVFLHSSGGEDAWYYVEYKTGLSAELPEGHVGLLFPRSSISKSSLMLSNSVGIIDQFFRGEICFRFKVDSGLVEQAHEVLGEVALYKKGDRIGQLLVIPYPTMEPEFVDELSETERGTGGFGHTGK